MSESLSELQMLFSGMINHCIEWISITVQFHMIKWFRNFNIFISITGSVLKTFSSFIVVLLTIIQNMREIVELITCIFEILQAVLYL